MTVGELIAKLQSMDHEEKVCILIQGVAWNVLTVRTGSRTRDSLIYHNDIGVSSPDMEPVTCVCDR